MQPPHPTRPYACRPCHSSSAASCAANAQVARCVMPFNATADRRCSKHCMEEASHTRTTSTSASAATHAADDMSRLRRLPYPYRCSSSSCSVSSSASVP
jgi:hypothetical protein